MKNLRLRQLLDALDVTPASFERKYLGETRAKNIYNWLDGDFPMKEAVVERIVASVKKARPNFNPEWFKEGRGDMFLQTGQEFTTHSTTDIEREMQFLKREVEFLQRENSVLKSFLREKGVDLGKFKGVINSPELDLIKRRKYEKPNYLHLAIGYISPN